MTDYSNIINSASQRFGVDPNLIRSVISVESSSRPNAVSHRGAGGLMQVMPGTYQELATKHGLGADRFDPTNNIMAGTAYLAQQQRQWGNTDDALAAYNAGPGRLAKVKSGQQARLPAETTNYVQKVKAGLPPQGGDMAGGLFSDQFHGGMGFGPRGGLLGPVPGEANGPPTSLSINPSIGRPAQPQPQAQPPVDINGRIQQLIGQQAGQQPIRQMSPQQYMMAGGLEAVTPLSGITNRRVGMGEVLGNLAAGVGRGQMASQQAERDARKDQFGELSNAIQIGNYQRQEATSARQLASAQAYADQLEKQGHTDMAQAVRSNPALVDEVLKARAAQVYQKDPDPTNAERNALAMGLQRGTPAFNDYIQKATMPAGSVNITNTQERAEDQSFGQELVKEYAGVRSGAEAAQNTLQQLQIARSIPVTSGALEPLKAQVGAFGKAFGIDDKTLENFGLHQATNAQAFTGVMQSVVLSVMQSQSGPQTDSDAKRIEGTVATLGNTDEARDFLLRTGQALANRKIQQRDFYDTYRQQKGTLDGVGSAWRQHLTDRPLVGNNPNTGLPVFYDEFVSKTKQANPNASEADILNLWKQKYG